MAGNKPAILLLQTQVRTLFNPQDRKILAIPITSPAQNAEATELLPKRTQCHRALQPPILPTRQLPLRHHPPQPRDGRSLPLHEDHRASAHALQDVGTDQAVPELRQGAGADRRPIDLLAEVFDPQVQAAADAADPSGDAHEEAGEGGGAARGEAGAEAGAQGEEAGGDEGAQGGGGGEAGKGDREGTY